MSKYFNPYTDFGFKKLFGEEGNKNLLIDFLNQLLPPHHQIADLSFQNVEQLPNTVEERKAFFDIYCEAQSGERFIVEMQKAKIDFFKDRSLYYLSYPIRDQARKNQWNFELSAIYFIAVLDFWYEDKKTAEFHRFITLKDQRNQLFYDKLGLIYLQMPAFEKNEKELETHFDKWAYFLKNLEKLEDIPQILNESVFTQAFKTAEVANFTQAQLEEYEKSKLVYLEMKAVTETAERDGMKKGHEQGKKEGKIEGRIEAQIEIILKMLDNGLSIPIIAKSVDMTEQKVQEIINSHSKDK